MENEKSFSGKSDIYREVSKKKFGKTVFPDKLAFSGVENKNATNRKMLVVLVFSILLVMLIIITGAILNSYLSSSKKQINKVTSNRTSDIQSRGNTTTSGSRHPVRDDGDGIIIVKNNSFGGNVPLKRKPDVNQRVYIDSGLILEIKKKIEKVSSEKRVNIRLLDEGDLSYKKIIPYYNNRKASVLLQPEDIVRYANFLCLRNGYSRVDAPQSGKKDPFIVKRGASISLGGHGVIRIKNYTSMLEIAITRLIFYYRKDFYKILRLKEKNLAFKKRMVDNMGREFIMRREILRVLNSSLILNQRIILKKMLKEIR